MAGDAHLTGSIGWSAALAALSEELDALDRRLDDPAWGPEDLPSATVLPAAGTPWTQEDRRRAEQLAVRLRALTARVEAARAEVADDLARLPRRRDAARAYGGR